MNRPACALIDTLVTRGALGFGLAQLGTPVFSVESDTKVAFAVFWFGAALCTEGELGAGKIAIFTVVVFSVAADLLLVGMDRGVGVIAVLDT